ncbi:MAG: hypothetical protein K2M15_07155 [Oscillospiraceae bacterium]|nr:hypothetical protein [Oscillospiraceae bacterium]MDE7171697.1 hypothetical protein [Oscillospiraceae bacterium]
MKVAVEDLLGKVLLVGITYYTLGGELIEQKQFWGTVVQADDQSIKIRQADGEVFALPPDLRAISPAAPGDYTLRSTGEVVTDPDFLSTWTCTKPD